MALCHRVFIAVAAVTLFALPYLRRAVVGTSCNAATCDCGPEKRARKYRYLSHFARACTYCEAGTAMWLQNLARQFEGLELEL